MRFKGAKNYQKTRELQSSQLEGLGQRYYNISDILDVKVDPMGDGSELRPADYFIKDFVLVDIGEDYL